jgi:hypothetical protein
MPYIGRFSVTERADYVKLDNISSQFNGSTRTFNLTSGGAAFYPASASSLQVSLNGELQEPGVSYSISGSEITFTTAPETSTPFFCIVLGSNLPINTVGDETVTGLKLSKPLNYDSGLFRLDSVNDTVHIGTGITFHSTDGIISNGGFNIGIQSGGLNISAGVVTAFNFIGAGNTFLYHSDTRTIDVSIAGGGGGTGSWERKTTTYTASVGDQLIADTSGGAFTITLPPSPSEGDIVRFADGASWSDDNLTLARNGSTIEGLSEDLVIDIGGVQIDLIYDGTTWEVYTNAGPSVSITDDTSTSTTQYPLMVRSTTGTATTSYVSSTKLYFNPNTGELSATDFNSLSDLRLKENISPIDNVMERLNMVTGVSFNWKDNGHKSYGVIAQEIEKVFPELVKNDAESQKTVSYIPLIAFLLEAVKSQQEQINNIISRIKE